jgi:trk system potassium uptake protein TrkH
MLLTGFSLTLIAPILVSLWYRDGEVTHFVLTFLLLLGIGLLLLLPRRQQTYEMHTRDGFLIVTLFWITMSACSALPFLFSPHLSFDRALFESISGFTTTGATVIVGLDNLPKSILYYRQQLQWLGGMGVVVLAVAIAPMLGVGGMKLYKAETPGPVKDDKLVPRIAQTARYLWTIYLGLTLVGIVAFWSAGMDLFDAVGHSFAAVSTGGFSTHDASIGYFDNPAIEWIATLLMFMGAVNFAVHFMVFREKGFRPWLYWRDPEVRGFIGLILVAAFLIALVLYEDAFYPDFWAGIRMIMFQVVSVITSTGFTTADFSQWPLFAPMLLIFISFVGGCAGSTAGGMKVIRWELMLKEAQREVFLLIHPRAIIPIKIGSRPVPDRVSRTIWGFFALYVITFVALMLMMLTTGIDPLTAFTAVATCINNLGPGLGEVSSNFASLDDTAIWISCFAMLLGRLEIFTLLVVLSPQFWKG